MPRAGLRSAARLAAAAVLPGALLLGGCAASVEPDPDPPAALRPAPPAALRTLPELGIEVVALRLSAAETMLDFRYRVTDAARAAALLGRDVEPHAVDLATGARLVVPRAAKIGPLRQTAVEAKEGRIYFVLFGNGGRLVKRGGRVTVVFGDRRIEDLTVE